ncbi:MAG: hypothetical protein Q3961_04610 [Bifidobacteriaceae bacterium]|nr:hypothetical protein [Bifidobacteriaceae bacterium]
MVNRLGMFNYQRYKTYVLVVITCLALVLCSSCSPVGSAVGRSRDKNDTTQVDGIDRNDMVVGLLGESQNLEAADRTILQTCEKNKVVGVYSATWDSYNYTQAAASGFADMISRPVNIILVNGLEYDSNSSTVREQWNSILSTARKAGIPVVLVNPRTIPQDDTLYAAVFAISSLSNYENSLVHESSLQQKFDKNSWSFDNAIFTIANNEYHEIYMNVTLP